MPAIRAPSPPKVLKGKGASGAAAAAGDLEAVTRAVTQLKDHMRLLELKLEKKAGGAGAVAPAGRGGDFGRDIEAHEHAIAKLEKRVYSLESSGGSGGSRGGSLSLSQPRGALKSPASKPTGRQAGKLYVLGGGQDTSNVYRSTEIYDLESQKWSKGPEMLEKRMSAGVAVQDGKIFVIGGSPGGSDRHKSVEFFDPSSGRWSQGT